MELSRRSMIALAGLGSAGTALSLRSDAADGQPAAPGHGGAHDAHYAGPIGRVSTAAFDPGVFTRTWNFSDLEPDKRPTFYREQRRPDGSLLREYDLIA